MASQEEIILHGFTPVPGDAEILLQSRENIKQSFPIQVSEIPLPLTPLVAAVRDYAQKELPKQTFHHSMRVFYYGEAIRRQHFTDWTFSSETYLLSALLHDIGTTSKNLRNTLLSFETYGGILAHALLASNSSPVAQNDAVVEAIVRHQDIASGGVNAPEGSAKRGGKIPALGQLLQLATIFDNMGGFEDLVHKSTIESVVEAWPREGWSECFAKTIREELELKPWAHTSRLGEKEFPEGVEGNKLMEPYD